MGQQERRDCPTHDESTYAKAVANPPTNAVAVAQTDAVENTPTVAVDTLSEDTPQTSSNSEGEKEKKKERRERRRKEKEQRKMDTSFSQSENKRKDVSSPETPTRTSRATHSGLPQRAPTHKLQKK